jgi:hypothetical protein
LNDVVVWNRIGQWPEDFEMLRFVIKNGCRGWAAWALSEWKVCSGSGSGASRRFRARSAWWGSSGSLMRLAFGLSCLVVMSWPRAALAVGGGESCIAAEAISGTGVFDFNNTTAPTDGAPSPVCSFFGQTQIDRDVWFCWTAPATPCATSYVIETCGQTSVDTKIAVYSGCSSTCPPTTPISCSDDDCGIVPLFRQTRVVFNAVPGQSYRIRIGTFPGENGGTGTFSISCPDRPDNDLCDDAEQIAGEDVFDFDNTLARQDGPLHAECAQESRQPRTDKDVWYCWTAPCTGTAFAHTCNLTPVDTKMIVYEGCTCPPAEPSLVACNDDDVCDFDSRQSQVAFPVVQGEQYLVRVGAFSDTKGGTGQFEVTCGTSNCPATGSCFSNRSTPGCEDQSCCEKVCAADRFCCEGEWDSICTLRASGLCAGNYNTCGPGRGSCTDFGGNGTAGCEIENCCNAVCEVDPFCCLSEWDSRCAVEAIGICSGNFFECNQFAGSCTGSQGNGSPGCNDIACCSDVCSEDTWCCVVEWDEVCALREASVCQLACGPGSGDCFAGNGTPGCEIAECCEAVCTDDPFCCFQEWDEICAAAADIPCPPECPVGTVDWVDPPDGAVYAGYPLSPWGGGLMGPAEIQLIGPAGAERRCFSLCETDQGIVPNSIVSLIENPIAGGLSSSYTLTLTRPITAGAATTITYTDNNTATQTATFIAHPGNVNGDALSSGADVMSMIDCCLNGDCAPWGLHSCDIDGSGAVHPPDLIGLIDLLNGAGPFDAWSGTSLPSADGVCP